MHNLFCCGVPFVAHHPIVLCSVLFVVHLAAMRFFAIACLAVAIPATLALPTPTVCLPI